MPETNFADFVKEAREKKKNEALAQAVLGSRGRNANNGAASQPNARNGSQKPNLASRMSSSSGVNKSRSSSAKPSPNIDGKWQHDLHKLNNPNGPANGKKLNRTASASQIDRNTRTFNKFRSVLQDNAPASDSSGFSIRGVATGGGPSTVIASNFAPGTTAADIEAVMAPIAEKRDSEIVSCRLLSSNPTVMVEMIVDRRDGAEYIVEMFNNQKADGRQLYVYIKDTATAQVAPTRPATRPDPPTGRLQLDDMDVDTDGGRSGSFQDGRFGFGEMVGRSPPRGPRRSPPTGPRRDPPTGPRRDPPSGPRRRY